MLINGLIIEKGGNMNDGNLIPLSKRVQREKEKIQKMGRKANKEKILKEKQEKEHRKKLAEVLSYIGFSEIKSPEIKRMLVKLGIEGNDYFTAMFAAAIVQSIKKGDMKAVAKVFELLEKSNNSNENPEEEKSFQNLIGAIKDV